MDGYGLVGGSYTRRIEIRAHHHVDMGHPDPHLISPQLVEDGSRVRSRPDSSAILFPTPINSSAALSLGNRVPSLILQLSGIGGASSSFGPGGVEGLGIP